MEEVVRILKAHDKALDNTLPEKLTYVFLAEFQPKYWKNYFRIPKTAPSLIAYTEILNWSQKLNFVIPNTEMHNSSQKLSLTSHANFW